MKKILFIGAIALITIIVFPPTFAQVHADSTAISNTTSTGIISGLSTDTMVIRMPGSAELVSYAYTKNTPCVDENDYAVSSERLKLGLPVTVDCEMRSDWRLAATKIMVRNATTAATRSP
jgi:hypothetical protein